MRQGIARHRLRRAQLTGVPEPPGPAAAPIRVIPFHRESRLPEPPRQEPEAPRPERLAPARASLEPPPVNALPSPGGVAAAARAAAAPLTNAYHPLPQGTAPVPASGAVICLKAVRREPGPERAAVEFTAPAPPLPRNAAPTPAAPLGRRLAATLTDAACAGLVAAGFGLGLHLTALGTGLSVGGRATAMMIAAVGLAAFLTVQLLCLCLPMATPGMRWLGLTVCGLDGEPAPAARWRRRGCATVLSLGALGLGYVWAYLDDDHLAWHDHLSRTVLGRLHR